MKTNKNAVVVKPYYLKELARLYQVSPRTMRNWIRNYHEAVGKPTGRLYTSRQVYIIFEKLGLPDGQIEE